MSDVAVGGREEGGRVLVHQINVEMTHGRNKKAKLFDTATSLPNSVTRM